MQHQMFISTTRIIAQYLPRLLFQKEIFLPNNRFLNLLFFSFYILSQSSLLHLKYIIHQINNQQYIFKLFLNQYQNKFPPNLLPIHVYHQTHSISHYIHPITISRIQAQHTQPLHLRPGKISISHRATTPHATTSTHPPKTTTLLSSPWIYSFPFLFFITPLHSTDPALFFSLPQESSLSSTPCYFSFDSSVLFADDRHRETSVVAFRKSRLFKPYRSAFRGPRGDGGGGGGCVFLRWRDKARLNGG